MAEPLKASQGSLFVQTTVGERAEYLGCVDVDAIPDPRGGITLIRCRDGNGEFATIGEIQDAPDVVSTTVTALVYPEADILDELMERACRANLFVTLTDCGKLGQFNNWARAVVLHHARLTDVSNSNWAMREAGDAATRALGFTGWGVYQLRNRFKVARQAIAETTDLNAIAFDPDTVCSGDCGEAQEFGDFGMIVADAPAGSPGEKADVWHTSDAGANWDFVSGAAGDPFAPAEDVVAAAIFSVDRATKRRLVVRGPVNGEPIKIAYSDDEGTTWTLVSLPSTNGEGVMGAKALFVMDRDHIWIASDAGSVYFSEDGGLTFTEQTSAAAADSAAQLNAIAFSDVDNGYAVGESAVIIRTQDGGESWNTVAGPANVSDGFTAVTVFSPFRFIIGTDADGLYQTRDVGDHWHSKTFAGQAGTGTVVALTNFGDSIVFMAQNVLGGQGYLHRSIDGGHSWERVTTPANSGLNDVVNLGANIAYVVGNANGGTGFIAKFKA